MAVSLPARLSNLALLALIVAAGTYKVLVYSQEWNDIALWQRNLFLSGDAGNPWQYRALSQWIAIWLSSVDLRGWWEYDVMRTAQTALLLVLAYVHYGQLGFRPRTRFLGLVMIILLSMLSLRPSTYSLDRFTDAIIYLLAGIALFGGWSLLLIPLAFLGSLNRETAGFIPFMILAKEGSALFSPAKRRQLAILIVALAAYTAAFFGIRAYYSFARITIQDTASRLASAFLFDVQRRGMWVAFFTAFNLLPFTSVVALPWCSAYLRRLFWIMVPAWIGIHFLTSWPREGLMFLPPIVSVLIPMTLHLVEGAAAWDRGPVRARDFVLGARRHPPEHVAPDPAERRAQPRPARHLEPVA
ncbi:MAG: hypothetical protein HYX52_06710 [Chloroflexi bacterium]|nr:hypothetical protein [Chloroflexota bacterium]